MQTSEKNIHKVMHGRNVLNIELKKSESQLLKSGGASANVTFIYMSIFHI